MDLDLVKVWLHEGGEHVESVWCKPCGDADGKPLFRLVNVPFLHAKPTWGDVIMAAPDPRLSLPLAFDTSGGYEDICERLHENGGRYAMILDYEMREDADLGATCSWMEERLDVIAEGCTGPRPGRPGRLYLAVPSSIAAEAILDRLLDAPPGFTFALVHPKPDPD